MKNKLQPIFLSVGLIFISLGLIINVITSMLTSSFNAIFGPGEKIIVPTSDSEHWDTDYYEYEAKNQDDIKERNDEFIKEVASEGIVLMENNDVLPLDKLTTLSPFGYGYNVPVYVGRGSGTTKFSQVVSPEKALSRNFIINEDVANITCNTHNIIELQEANGTSNDSSYGMNNRINQIDYKSYEKANIESLGRSYGIVFIARDSAENIDIKSDGYVDGTKHRLALTQNELETIRFSKKYCKGTIVVLNVPAHFELTPILQNANYKVDAILHVGYPGSIGFEALSDVLCGLTNPSGRTVDTYTSNLLSSPSMQNFGAHFYKNYTSIPYIEYEEGIYVGYKYYETLYEESLIDSTIHFNYENVVLRPFGYGLSYTDFYQKITEFKVEEDVLKISVEVENIGTKAGKDTIMLFYGAPYTSFDASNKIEKSSKNLFAFKKTPIIKPKETYEYHFETPIKNFASYFSNYYIDDERVGTYFLEKGTYKIYLGQDAHDYYEMRTFDLSKDVFYNAELSDGYKNPSIASNKFEYLTYYMLDSTVTNLSRSNFVNTYPEKARNYFKNLEEEYYTIGKEITDFDYENHPVLGNNPNSQIYETESHVHEKNNLTLSSLRGYDYNDPLRTELLKNIDFNDESSFDELRDLFIFAGFGTSKLSSINKPTTNDFDGPSGFNDAYNQFKDSFYCYPSEVVVAQTFNEELVEKMGTYIGEEAILNNISGWYAPGLNIHRTPFGGRTFEYYSEDPFLSGHIAKSVTNGVASKGVYPYLKHFILNEQESYRSSIRVWVNEQTLRELYLKPFEIVIKEAKVNLKYTKDSTGEIATKTIDAPLAVMSAFNYVGPYPSSCCRALLTDLLRKEWGFKGFVISDYEVKGSHDARIRCGNDLYLWSSNRIEVKENLNTYIKDTKSATSQKALIKSIKAVAYTVVNSNAFNNVAPGYVSYYKTPVWKIILNYTMEYSFYALGTLGVLSFIASVIYYNKKAKNSYSIYDEK